MDLQLQLGNTVQPINENINDKMVQYYNIENQQIHIANSLFNKKQKTISNLSKGSSKRSVGDSLDSEIDQLDNDDDLDKAFEEVIEENSRKTQENQQLLELYIQKYVESQQKVEQLRGENSLLKDEMRNSQIRLSNSLIKSQQQSNSKDYLIKEQLNKSDLILNEEYYKELQECTLNQNNQEKTINKNLFNLFENEQQNNNNQPDHIQKNQEYNKQLQLNDSNDLDGFEINLQKNCLDQKNKQLDQQSEIYIQKAVKQIQEEQQNTTQNPHIKVFKEIRIELDKNGNPKEKLRDTCCTII